MKGIGRNATTGLFLAIFALVASAGLTFRNIRAISEKEGWVVHTHQVMDALNLVWSTVKDAERGQRGFLVTGREEYLEPYNEALQELPKITKQAVAFVADNPEQARRMDSLERRLDERLASLARGIERRREGGFDAALEHVRQGTGRSQMVGIHDLVEEMNSAEEKLLDVRTADSRTIYGTAYATAIVATGVGLLLVGIVYFLANKEIAQRARVAEELERRVQLRTVELNQANEALQISNRELEQFASVASHDLQEPLRKIEAFGDRLKTQSFEAMDDQGRDYLGRILASASRMRTLINDLLTFSRVTTKAQPFAMVELKTVAEEVVSDLEGRLQQSGGRVETGELPRIEADPLQMRQLFQNLIGNGLKFQRPGIAPVVTVAAAAVESGGRPACVLTVADNGIGFEEIYLDRIFNVFQRLHGRNEYEGTGMGLAICRKIVERHGGTITAKSAPGEGARFIVTLPVTQSKRNTDDES